VVRESAIDAPEELSMTTAKTTAPKKTVATKAGAKTEAATKAKATKAPSKETAKPGKGDAVVSGIRVSSAERVIDAASGATKLDLVRYYDSVADLILPHLKGRPVSLVR
jgi:bifunctional non-homologous end joining protein LigD